MSRRQRFAILYLDAGERRRCFIIGLCMSVVCASVPVTIGCSFSLVFVILVQHDAGVFCGPGGALFGSNLLGVVDHVADDPQHPSDECDD